MKTVAFQLVMLGDEKVLAQQKKVGQAISDSVRQLQDFEKASKAIDLAREKSEALSKQLGEVSARLQQLGKQMKDGKIAPEGLKRAGQEYGTLVERARQLKEQSGSAAAELRLLTRAAKEGAGRSDLAYQQLVSRVAQLKAEQSSVTKEIRQQSRAFEAQKFAQGSYRALNQELGDLRTKFRDLGEEAREGTFGKKLVSRIVTVDAKLKELDSRIGISVRNVGNYRDAFSGLNQALSRISGFTVFGLGIGKVVQGNAELSDSLASVRKTTQLGTETLEGFRDIVKGLEEQLKSLDTRTSLADLLDISRIGGQLGIGKEFIDEFERIKDIDPVAAQLELDKAEEELLKFTQAIDQLTVSLSDELQGGVEGVSRDVGKLSELLGASVELGTAEGILAIGSAINSLGASGTAEGSKIVDFAKRLAGLAPQAKISAADILGLGAALDQFGQSPELAATAVTKLLVSIGEDVPRFAKIAGVSVQELSTLLAEDGNAAFLKVLEGAQSTGGGLEELTKILADFGIESARSTPVLGALISNLDEVKKAQKTAGDQFEIARGNLEGTLSVTQEFNTQNTTLAAELSKVGQQIKNFFTSSGFAEFMAAGVRGISAFIAGLSEIPNFLKENRVAILALITAIIAFRIESIKAAAANLKLAISLKRKVIADKAAAISQRLLNAAMKANPVGFLIGVLATLVGVVTFLWNTFDGFRQTLIRGYNAIVEFSEGSGFLNKAIKLLIAPIQAVVFVVRNFGAIWAGVRASFDQAITNIKSGFQSLLKSAQIAGKKIELFFTFDDAKEAVLRKEIQELERAKKALQDQQRPLSEAFAEGYRNAQEKARQLALEAERKDKAERLKAARELGQEEADARAGGYKQKFDEEAKRQREQEIKDREAAAKRIIDLENALLSDETSRAAATATTEAGRDLSDLVGDPAQIVEQTRLVRAALAQSLKDIFSDRRSALLDAAQEDLGEIDSGGLLPSPEAIQARADAISDVLEVETRALFAQQEEALKASAEANISALVGNPETVASQAQAIREQLAADLGLIAQQRQAFNDQLTEQEAARQQTVRSLQVESLEQQLEQEEARRKEALAKKLAGIFADAEAEIISQQQAKDQIAEAEEESRQAELEALEEFEEKKAEVIAENALELIELQTSIAEREIQLNKEKVDRLLAEEERLKKGRDAALQVGLRTLGDFVSGTKDLLGQDENNRRKHGATLKALSLSEIAINLIREISAIRAANSTYPEPFASFIKGAAIATAIATAAVSSAKVIRQKFRFGGPIDEASPMYVDTEGTLRNGPTSSDPLTRAIQGPKISKGLKGYRPAGSVFVVGSGYVPSGGGRIIGASHAQGGVKAITRHGDLVEMEGEEYLLRNGPETYVINRRSARRFRHLLDRMRSGSSRFDPGRRRLAGQINSFKGWGVQFSAGGMLQDGGVLTSQPGREGGPLSINAIRPPIPPVNVAKESEALPEMIREQSQLLEQNLRALDKKTDAIMDTVVNSKVIADPAEIVREGLKQLRENGEE